MNISGVILAGGINSRFDGIIKAKISIGGKTIISRIIDTIEGVFDEIIIVTNIPEEFTGFDNLKITARSFSEYWTSRRYSCCNKGLINGGCLCICRRYAAA